MATFRNTTAMKNTIYNSKETVAGTPLDEMTVVVQEEVRQFIPPPISTILPKLKWETFLEVIGDTPDVNSTAVKKKCLKDSKQLDLLFWLLNYCVDKHNTGIQKYNTHEFDLRRSNIQKIKSISNGACDRMLNNLKSLGFIIKIQSKSYNLEDRGVPAVYQMDRRALKYFTKEYKKTAKAHNSEKSKYNKLLDMGINPDQKFTCYCCGSERSILEGQIDKYGKNVVHKVCSCKFKAVRYDIKNQKYWDLVRDKQPLGEFEAFSPDVEQVADSIAPITTGKGVIESDIKNMLHELATTLTLEQQREALKVILEAYKEKD